MFGIDQPIYFGKFTVTNSTNVGTRVFYHTTKFPLGDFVNPYNEISQTQGALNWLVPWSLMRAFYSKQVKIDWEMHITPVKVADCRVSFDIIFQYEDTINTNYVARTLAHDNLHYHVDSQDAGFSFKIPMIWTVNNVHTDVPVWHDDNGPRFTIPNAYLPNTVTKIFVRNTYQPNMLQPDTVEFVVTLRPIVQNAIGIAGKAPVFTLYDAINDTTCRPYFFSKS
jgi:hypothetical protein